MLILTSIGLSAPTSMEAFRSNLPSKFKSAAIVTTALNGKEKNEYARLAHEQLLTCGLGEVNFIDLEISPNHNFDRYNVLYVCGGNTFKLLKFARAAKFDEAIVELQKRGGVYIGVSAGSILLTQSIRIAGEVLGDENEVGLTDLTGLNLYPRQVLPHYVPDIELTTVAYEDKYSVAVDRIGNLEAIIVDGETVTRIGQ